MLMVFWHVTLIFIQGQSLFPFWLLMRLLSLLILELRWLLAFDLVELSIYLFVVLAMKFKPLFVLVDLGGAHLNIWLFEMFKLYIAFHASLTPTIPDFNFLYSGPSTYLWINTQWGILFVCVLSWNLLLSLVRTRDLISLVHDPLSGLLCLTCINCGLITNFGLLLVYPFVVPFVGSASTINATS